jgi:hypothetical protein
VVASGPPGALALRMQVGLSGFEGDCQRQREIVAARVPAYGELLAQVLAHVEKVAQWLEPAWRERAFAVWYERPLLLLASLRYDALREGAAHPLHRALVKGELGAEISLASLERALAPERRALYDVLAQRAVQTNETSRGVVWLLPASLIAQVAPGASLALADLGASAGLNLAADGLPSIWSTGDGTPLSFGSRALPPIVARWGFDLSPLNVDRPEDARWLEACVWPAEHERLTRLSSAISAYRALAQSASPPRLYTASAVDMPPLLGELARAQAPDTFVLAYQTIVRDYLSQEDRERYVAGMRAFLAARPRALWVELEGTPGVGDLNLAFTLTVHTREESYELARTGPHPRVLQLDAQRLAALRQRIASQH